MRPGILQQPGSYGVRRGFEMGCNNRFIIFDLVTVALAVASSPDHTWHSRFLELQRGNIENSKCWVTVTSPADVPPRGSAKRFTLASYFIALLTSRDNAFLWTINEPHLSNH